MARAYKVRLHTHLCETLDEEPLHASHAQSATHPWMEKLDWLGSDVWFAHAIHVNQAEIDQFAQAGVGMAHCPCSNMRLASGIAPIREYLTPACRSDWVSTARPATMPPTSYSKPARPSC